MKYVVEDFDTCETLAICDTEKERSEWIAKNTHPVWNVVDYARYTDDGKRIAIYEIGR